MLAEVKDLVRLLRRIAVTVAGTVILAVGGLTVLVTMAYGVRELRRAEKTAENDDAGQ
jgi:hypothetical protein